MRMSLLRTVERIVSKLQDPSPKDPGNRQKPPGKGTGSKNGICWSELQSSWQCPRRIAANATRQKRRALSNARIVAHNPSSVKAAMKIHTLIQSFITHNNGRFSNVTFLLQELLKLPQFALAKVTVVYDVACQLEGHLKARYPELPHERLSFAIPVFHAYGHKLLCQVTKSVRSTKGVGQADGENLERLWSYLRTFGPMTKEMEASKRIDLLSYALFHYSRKERKKLGQSLQQRLDRSAQGKAEAKKDIELLTNFFEDVVIDEELVKGWATEDAEAIKSASNSTARVTDADDYVLKLSILYFNPQDTEAENDVILAEELHGWDRSAWAADSEQYKQSLQRYAAKTRENLLRKLRQGCFDRLTHIDQLRKYGIGQALSQQIGKNIKSATKKLLDDLKSYNKLAHIPAPPHFPMKLSIEEVTVPESDCFSYSIQLHTSSNFGMSKAKRQLVAAFAKKKRAEEEHDLVEADKTATLQFFQKEHTRLISFMKDLFQDDEEEFDLHGVVQSCHSRGILSFLFHKLWAIEREIEQFLAVWGQKNTLCNVASNFVFESLIENASEIPRETDDEVVFMIDDLMEQLTEPVDAQQVLATLNDNDTGNDDITV